MPYYRLYHLDPHTGHIDRAEELFAADDVAAVHDLQQRRSPHPLELWLGGRKVASRWRGRGGCIRAQASRTTAKVGWKPSAKIGLRPRPQGKPRQRAQGRPQKRFVAIRIEPQRRREEGLGNPPPQGARLNRDGLCPHVVQEGRKPAEARAGGLSMMVGSRDDRSYFEARAEAEIEAANQARHPDAARAHYILAAHYLDLAHNPEPVVPAAPGLLAV
jgi:hypothetical protein